MSDEDKTIQFPQPKEDEIDRELRELKAKLDEENLRWMTLQISTVGINVDAYLLDTQLMTLIRYLVGKGVIDEREINLEYRKFLLERLTAFREANADEIMRQRVGPPKLVDPHGRTLLH